MDSCLRRRVSTRNEAEPILVGCAGVSRRSMPRTSVRGIHLLYGKSDMRKLRKAVLALLALLPILAAAAAKPAGTAAAAAAATPAPAATAASNVKLEDLTVMALGALDGRAVLKGPDGKLQVLKVGDTIAGTHAVVSQVLADKVIVKDTVLGADKAPKTQTVWISKATQAGGKSSVQRLDNEAPPARVIQGQVMKTLPAPPAATNTKKSN